MTYGWLEFFTDPILRGPTIGSMLMCTASSIIGVIVFIRRRSLVGETLSHATYPGLILGAFLCSALPSFFEPALFCFLLGGAFIASVVAVFLLQVLQNRFRVKNDAALCFVLSSFFGVGVLLAGRMQNTHPVWFRQIQTFLYGQAATMTDLYIWIYGALFLSTVFFVTVFYHPLRLVYFDGTFASAVGFSVKKFERFFFFLLILAVIVAMKSVGVVLLSGMLIAPALSARKLTHRLPLMFWIAGLIGAFAGFFGNYLSVLLSVRFFAGNLVFPTGPMIVLLGSVFCFLILSFKERKKRKVPFVCYIEDVLKAFPEGREITCKEAARLIRRNVPFTFFLLQRARQNRWMERRGSYYWLSEEGALKAKEIIRLERLFGVYLNGLQQGGKADYKSASQIAAFLREEGNL